MPVLSKVNAAERLAAGVEHAKPTWLAEIYAELFPEQPPAATPRAADLARLIRNGLEAEELVDLWNVVFPEDRNVRYDEDGDEIHYNEVSMDRARAD